MSETTNISKLALEKLVSAIPDLSWLSVNTGDAFTDVPLLDELGAEILKAEPPPHVKESMKDYFAQYRSGWEAGTKRMRGTFSDTSSPNEAGMICGVGQGFLSILNIETEPAKWFEIATEIQAMWAIVGNSPIGDRAINYSRAANAQKQMLEGLVSIRANATARNELANTEFPRVQGLVTVTKFSDPSDSVFYREVASALSEMGYDEESKRIAAL